MTTMPRRQGAYIHYLELYKDKIESRNNSEKSSAKFKPYYLI
jgi:hypothetical protein